MSLFSMTYFSTILRIAIGISLVAGARGQEYRISTFAGGVAIPASIPAQNAILYLPESVAVDTKGSVYFSASFCVFRLDASGALTRIAGTGVGGFSGDGGPAIRAQLNAAGVVADSFGNLYIADYGNDRIRRVSASGIITTVAGGGRGSDGGPAIGAQLTGPYGLAADGSGNLYIAELDGDTIRKVSAGGVITTVAGTGVTGYSGDGGPATSAKLNQPTGVAVDSSGNLYIAEWGNSRIRKVSADGVITTVAGAGGRGYTGDGGPATSAQLYFPEAVAVDSSGNLYIADDHHRIRKVSENGIITTVAGTGGYGYSGDGGPAASATLYYPFGVAVDNSGSLYIADYGNDRIRKVSPNGIIGTVAGGGSGGDGGPAINAQLYYPTGVAADISGNVYIADFYGHRIRKVSANGIITTAAGTGAGGYSGDGGPATSAQLYYPTGAAVDSSGNLYIADYGNHRLRKVSAAGIITTVAGASARGYAGDGGPAGIAQLDSPAGVAVDGSGNLYVVDLGNNRIRKVSSSGAITTVAGTGVGGYSGDGGPAIRAQLYYPAAIAVDGSGSLYIADYQRIRKVSASGIITTVAGTGTRGWSGSCGLLATANQLDSPVGVAVDGIGSLYIAEYGNHRVCKVSPNGVITTVADNGITGYSLDGGPATAAGMGGPFGVAVDPGSRKIYVTDTHAVRLLQPLP